MSHQISGGRFPCGRNMRVIATTELVSVTKVVEMVMVTKVKVLVKVWVKMLVRVVVQLPNESHPIPHK